MQDRYCDMEDKAPATATVTVTVTVTVTEMTGNDVLLSDFVEQEESSIMESQKKESSEWTNEKHSLYLKSIEASFIDQLYNSSDMQSWPTQKNCSSDSISTRKGHAKARIPSGQFKVLRDGFWSKKNFRRLKDANRPVISPGNPWVQHFTNGNRHGAVALPSRQERPSSTATQLCHQVSGLSNTAEMTDQNFVEEDVTTNKANRQSSRKRKISSIVSHSTNDQVVPFGTFPATQTADNYIPPKE